jgi:hypothetical protein
MPFKIPEFKEGTKFEKVNFLKLTPGSHIVRLLEKTENAHTVTTHYVMNKFTIECPGEGCPVCENNKKIIYEHEKDFRDQSGYSQKNTRYLINVLDRTIVKSCQACQAEVPVSASVCPECKAFITNVPNHPSNKVKVLGFGVKLATDLNAIEQSICDPNGEPLGLMNFDVILSVDTKPKTAPTPIPLTSNNDVVDIPADALQDVTKATIKLNPAEIIDLLRGVSLKDIFKARGNSTPQEVTEEKSPEQLSDLKESIAGILD